MKNGRAICVLSLLLLGSCAFFRPPAPVSTKAQDGSTFALDTLQAAVLREVNRTRHAYKAPALVDDSAMTRAAVLYSAELATRGQIEHYSMTPGRKTLVDRLDAASVSYAAAGENLATFAEQPERVGARAADLWLHSPAHRRTMLNWKYERSGVGVTRASDGTWYVVQVYAW